MAEIIRVAIVLTYKFHIVIIHDVIGILIHKFFDAVPEGLNSLPVLVETEHPAVFLLVLSHELERIETDITVV